MTHSKTWAPRLADSVLQIQRKWMGETRSATGYLRPPCA